MGGDPISIGLMVASSLIGAAGEADQANAEARVADQNAQAALMQGALEETAIRKKERAVSGEAIAALAGNGVAVGTGSALDLLRQSAVEREYDVLQRRYSAASDAYNLSEEARQKRAAAKGALFKGVPRAGASVITSGAQADAAGRVLTAQTAGGMRLPMPATSTYVSGAPVRTIGGAR